MLDWSQESRMKRKRRMGSKKLKRDGVSFCFVFVARSVFYTKTWYLVIVPSHPVVFNYSKGTVYLSWFFF